MAHNAIFVHHCNCITVLLISGFACAAIRLSFDRGPDMLIDVVSSNKRIKFIRTETCVNCNFFSDKFSNKSRTLLFCLIFPFDIFCLGFISFIRSPAQKPDFYLLRRYDGICEKLQSSLVGFSSKIR